MNATDATALHAELTELLRTALTLDVPAPDTDLIATGRLDSMGMVELLLSLERRYGLVVDMRQLDVAQFRSVATIAEFVAATRSNGNGVSPGATPPSGPHEAPSPPGRSRRPPSPA